MCTIPGPQLQAVFTWSASCATGDRALTIAIFDSLRLAHGKVTDLRIHLYSKKRSKRKKYGICLTLHLRFSILKIHVKVRDASFKPLGVLLGIFLNL